MNGNAELLNFVYQNAQMGVETIPKLLEIVVEGEFREYLQNQLEGYKSFLHKAERMLRENGYDEKGIGLLEKMQSYLMLNIQTIMDSSVSHIAEMMIQGSTMGVTDALKNLHKYENGADKDILKLMKSLQEYEEKNIEALKKFV